jgi:RimJ/RimL family protein N-acetyltransferase
MHSFTTERLLIRPLAEHDKDLYISLYTDAKIMRNISEPLTVPASIKAFNNTLKTMKKDSKKIMTWTIVTLKDNKSIGIQGLNWKKTDTAEIGIMLLRNSNGMLLPEEAIGSLIEYGFNHLSLQQINACFEKKNLATARVSRKTGFIFKESQQPVDKQQRIECVFKNSWSRHYITSVQQS